MLCVSSFILIFQYLSGTLLIYFIYKAVIGICINFSIFLKFWIAVNQKIKAVS
ncbi:hypothetical protein AWRIB429_0198 [Oenococcus oeni AWRIB429]|uniref:Uncharacterized protein n=1 Tax=Oenococcus oeni AWRIB429 TaxID=655225 RepID=D3L768_OENOE|nr:hypothetical protein AWRIB429_0198 [Oenococcus oeni AWRIB429]